MKNAPLFLLGLFVALAISFGGIVLGSHAQLGRMTPYFDDTEGQAFPSRATGIAARGQQVYADLGCAACHTQQVRRPDFGSDQARGWGERQSVARDYIHQARPQLGASRLGPDLTNVGARKPAAHTAEGLYRLLYLGAGTHPAYAFLFEEREIAGEPSPHAVQLAGGAAPAAGREVVPADRARELVAYLLGLNNAYDYPEARPVAPPAKAAPAPAPGPVTPIPAAAPDEKKKK
ncbi:MAG: cbb3-type cytochrome c oxidase subunit II [Opitutaceae bacterium]